MIPRLVPGGGRVIGLEWRRGWEPGDLKDGIAVAFEGEEASKRRKGPDFHCAVAGTAH